MSIQNKIHQYQQKNLQHQLLIGVSRFFIVLLGVLALLFILEYFLWFNRPIRTVIFYGSVTGLTALLYVWIIKYLVNHKSGIQETARTISAALPSINDELINYLQLGQQSRDNALGKASLDQRYNLLLNFNFLDAIPPHLLKRLIRYLGTLVLVILLVAFASPDLFREGGTRILQPHREFTPPAPFNFVLLNDSLSVFQGDNFKVEVALTGNSVPDNCFLRVNDQKRRMIKSNDNVYSLTLSNVQTPITFTLSAAGYKSHAFHLTLKNHPRLQLLHVALNYPDYMSIEDQTIANRGDLRVPYGTVASWALNTRHADQVNFVFNQDSTSASRLGENNFSLQKQLLSTTPYALVLKNQAVPSGEALTYHIDVVPDLAPKLFVEFIPDSANFKYAYFAGVLKDDYGFSSLQLNIQRGNQAFKQQIPIHASPSEQKFLYRWVPETPVNPGEQVSFQLALSDNKPVKTNLVISSTYYLNRPNATTLSKQLTEKSQDTDNQILKSISVYEELNKELQSLQEQLSSQQKVDWQSEKSLQSQVESKRKLNELLEELSRQFNELAESSKNFIQSEQLKRDTRELAQLFEQLAAEQNSPLLDEIEKLLEEQKLSELNEKVKQLSRDDQRRQRDLERARELFQRLLVQQQLQRQAELLGTLAEEQDQIANDPNSSSDVEKADAQEQINRDFDELAEALNETYELNKKMNHPAPVEDISNDRMSTEQDLRDALEQLQQEHAKQAQQKQQRAAQRMRQMQQKLTQMSGNMQMETMTENIDQLRNILDDLVKLSYSQENLRKAFDETSNSNPKYLELSQEQLVIKEDAAVIEDSLLSLANRVVQLSMFITKEVDDVNYSMENAMEEIRERQKSRAMMHQQFAMTAMNNLALLLNDVLSQMQMSLSESLGNPSKGKQPNMPLPGLLDKQQQLGQKIKDLQGGNQASERLSEELARMAAEQELIRRQLEELRKQLAGPLQDENATNHLNEAIRMMEKNEEDLVFKRLTHELIKRQKAITSRMLNAQTALREQEKDPDRRAETANDPFTTSPPLFQEYLRLRKKEIELLRSVPVDLQPFYRNEVNEYFERLSPDKQ